MQLRHFPIPPAAACHHAGRQERSWDHLRHLPKNKKKNMFFAFPSLGDVCLIDDNPNIFLRNHQLKVHAPQQKKHHGNPSNPPTESYSLQKTPMV